MLTPRIDLTTLNLTHTERAEMTMLVAKGYSWPEAVYAFEHKLLDCQKGK